MTSDKWTAMALTEAGYLAIWDHNLPDRPWINDYKPWWENLRYSLTMPQMSKGSQEYTTVLTLMARSFVLESGLKAPLLAWTHDRLLFFLNIPDRIRKWKKATTELNLQTVLHLSANRLYLWKKNFLVRLRTLIFMGLTSYLKSELERWLFLTCRRCPKLSIPESNGSPIRIIEHHLIGKFMASRYRPELIMCFAATATKRWEILLKEDSIVCFN